MVQLDRLHQQNIRKEEACSSLYTTFNINPLKPGTCTTEEKQAKTEHINDLHARQGEDQYSHFWYIYFGAGYLKMCLKNVPILHLHKKSDACKIIEKTQNMDL